MQEKIKKLPKWAQELIQDIGRERDSAIDALNQFTDSQTESCIWHEKWPCTGEGGKRGPVPKRRYIQDYKMDFEFEGVHLTVLLREDSGIDLSYSSVDRHHGDVALVPRSFQQVYLVSKKHMRGS